MKSVFITTAVVIGLAAATGLAAWPDGCRESHSLTIADAERKADRIFTRVDANADGEISPQEFQASPRAGHRHRWGRGMHHAGMHAMGKTGGQAPAELAAKRDALKGEIFQELDSNSDSQLSQKEFDRLREVTRSVVTRHAFSHLDSNADGRLTADEFPRFVNRLKALDSDNNGTVTAAEMRAGFKKRLDQPENSDNK